MDIKQKIRTHYPGMILLVVILLTGLLTYQEYGISWDEPTQQGIGGRNYDYAFNNDTTWATYGDRDYGGIYEMALIAVERLGNITDSRDVYLMRHIVSHLFFIVGLCFFYLLGSRLFRSRLAACLCVLMLALCPRIYAHSFINTKDIPFLSVLIIALYMCLVAWQSKKALSFFIAGVFCGLATSIRIMGLMLPAYGLMFILVDLAIAIIKKDQKQKILINGALYLLAFCLSVYTFWPHLWDDPLKNMIGAFESMSHYRWGGTLFINGELIGSGKIPWYFFPVWFLITNPVMWLCAGFGGIVLLFINFFKNPFSFISNTDNRFILLFFLCFITPVAAVVVLHSVMYDDWRHLFFVYPSFVLLAVYFITRLAHGKLKVVIFVLVLMQVSVTGYTMYQVFPLNQVYFNPLVSHKSEYLRRNYEMDYWGASLKQGLDQLIKTYPYRQLWVTGDKASLTPLRNNIMILQKSDRDRIHYVGSAEEAEFFLTDYRLHPGDYEFSNSFYSIKAFNSTVLQVYQLK